MSQNIAKKSKNDPHLDRKQSPLLQVLQNPKLMTDLDVNLWNQALYEAHMLKLKGRLAYDAEDNDLWNQIPKKVQNILTNAKIEVTARQRRIMWEVNRVRRALFGFEDKIILVKGAAYIEKKLICARGRHSVDIDLLVAKKNLDFVENQLLKAGYQSQVLNDYDQKYYRDWAHELPPLMHPDRMIEVDVHHTILQITNKLSPEIDLMIDEAVCLEENIYSLSHEDILLHSIVHQFIDGEVKGSLRNLLEQHDMIVEFSQNENFWDTFLQRAHDLNFGRPVFYCLRYCQKFFNTPIPKSVIAQSNKNAPGWIALKIMDFMINRSMIPFGHKRNWISSYIATNGLYLRSHWLRMPPLMLVSHLSRKLLRRFGVGSS